MKKFFIFAFFTLSTCTIIAQSLTSTFTKDIKINSEYWGKHTFKSGDTVSILGYTKYLGSNLFAIETTDYIEIIESVDIPFDVTEKGIKKLPKTTNSKFKASFATKQEELLLQKKREYKDRALNGDIWFIYRDSYYFIPSIF